MTAEFETASVAYLKKKSNYPDFLHIWMAFNPDKWSSTVLRNRVVYFVPTFSIPCIRIQFM